MRVGTCVQFADRVREEVEESLIPLRVREGSVQNLGDKECDAATVVVSDERSGHVSERTFAHLADGLVVMDDRLQMDDSQRFQQRTDDFFGSALTAIDEELHASV